MGNQQIIELLLETAPVATSTRELFCIVEISGNFSITCSCRRCAAEQGTGPDGPRLHAPTAPQASFHGSAPRLGTAEGSILMSLKSQLFRGDPKLEAAAVSHPAHIVPGAVGEHVAKIQQALMALDGGVIDRGELTAKRYGPSTANVVLSYKNKRSIINRSYQAKADNIVGIMTISALDNEMLQREKTITMETIRCDFGGQRRPGQPV
jgi:hypothetical protein